MTMIERVAKAIELSGLAADSQSATRWTDLMDAARAAIEAMREPTERMLNAPIGDFIPSTVADHLDNYSAKQVWQAMADAALDPRS